MVIVWLLSIVSDNPGPWMISRDGLGGETTTCKERTDSEGFWSSVTEVTNCKISIDPNCSCRYFSLRCSHFHFTISMYFLHFKVKFECFFRLIGPLSLSSYGQRVPIACTILRSCPISNVGKREQRTRRSPRLQVLQSWKHFCGDIKFYENFYQIFLVRDKRHSLSLH